MFFLSKLATFMLLPPSILILAFLAAFLLFIAGKKKAGAILGLAALVVTIALSLGIVSDALIRPLEDRYAPLASTSRPLDSEGGMKDAMVVVLGGGIVKRSPEEGMKASLAPEPTKRLLYGLRIARDTGLPLVYSGGRTFDGPEVETEAEAARRFVEENAPGAKALFEDESRTTLENAVNVGKRYHPGTVVLVTSAYHMPRSVWSFEREGMKVIPAPTDYKASRAPRTVADFMPSAYALWQSYQSLHEYLGMLGYRGAPRR